VEVAGVDMTVSSWGHLRCSLLFAALNKVTSATARQVIVIIVSSRGFLFLICRKQEKHPKRIDFDMSKSAAVHNLAVVMKPQLISEFDKLVTHILCNIQLLGLFLLHQRKLFQTNLNKINRWHFRAAHTS